jgi:protoheme IX farnesyltransferase
VPGAIPPLIGWAAARGRLDPGAWVLFFILFFWQMPHFLALAALYRRDYARAGFRVLPVVDPGGASTARQSVLYALALLVVSLMPTLAGMAGPLYFFGALVLGLGFLAAGARFALRPGSQARAASLFRYSLFYLPALCLLMAWG